MPDGLPGLRLQANSQTTPRPGFGWPKVAEPSQKCGDPQDPDTVNSKKFDCGPRTIYAGFPASQALGVRGEQSSTILLYILRNQVPKPTVDVVFEP